MLTPPELLSASVWASTLEPDALERAARECTTRVVDGGAFVFRTGEPVEHWAGVLDGLLKMSKLTPEGRTISFTGMPRGAWFGEGTLIKREARRYDVTALRRSRIALMPRATFDWLMDHSIAFNRFLIAQLNERLGQFIAMVEHERALGPDARVARAIAQLFDPILYPHTGPHLQASQEEIGSLAGVSRQRANQALRALEKAGLLRLDYAGVTVVDLAGLRTFER